MSKVVPIEDLGPSVATHNTCLLVPYGRDRSKFLAEVRAALACGEDVDVVVIVPRRSPLLRWRLRKLGGLRLCLVSSPEPARQGLSLGRALKNWERVITGDSVKSITSEELRPLLAMADENPDAGLISSSTLNSVWGLSIRVSARLAVINRLAVNLADGVDESMMTVQEMVDELAGRFLRMSIPLIGRRVDPREQPPLSRVVEQRYPWLGVNAQQPTPSGSSTSARSPRSGTFAREEQIAVLLDLTKVTNISNGTGQHALHTLRALSERDELVIEAQTGAATDGRITHECEALGIQQTDELAPGRPLFDVAFSPCQFESVSEVDQLRSLAERIIVSHLDFIAIDNPTYHPDTPTWLRRREDALAALMAVDGVAWLSDTVRKRAISLGFDAERVPNRVCGTVIEVEADSATDGSQPVSGPYVAILGASYHHKGRLYALRLFEQIVRHGWPGQLVLAGWDPPHGSSRDDEQSYIAASSILLDRVVQFGTLSPSDQRAIINGAIALLQPSLSEGFGLLPGEAALLGTPTVMLRRSSLKEIYPADYPGWITGSDLEQDVSVVTRLLDGGYSKDAATELAQAAERLARPEYGRQLTELVAAVNGTQ